MMKKTRIWVSVVAFCLFAANYAGAHDFALDSASDRNGIGIGETLLAAEADGAVGSINARCFQHIDGVDPEEGTMGTPCEEGTQVYGTITFDCSVARTGSNLIRKVRLYGVEPDREVVCGPSYTNTEGIIYTYPIKMFVGPNGSIQIRIVGGADVVNSYVSVDTFVRRAN